MMNQKIKDVVCGMDVTSDSAFHTRHENKEYYFCSIDCQGKFTENPEAYIEHKHDENCTSCAPLEYATVPPVGIKKEQDSHAMYTCPMHPEIQQIGPGTCPKCGMALEPMVAEIGEEDTEELDDMTRRFKVSSLLAIPVFLLAMIADLAPQWLPEFLSMKMVQWIEFVLATPVVLWGGWAFFVRGVNSVKTWNLGISICLPL